MKRNDRAVGDFSILLENIDSSGLYKWSGASCGKEQWLVMFICRATSPPPQASGQILSLIKSDSPPPNPFPPPARRQHSNGQACDSWQAMG